MVLGMQIELTSKATLVKLGKRVTNWEEWRWELERREKGGGMEGEGGSEEEEG